MSIPTPALSGEECRAVWFQPCRDDLRAWAKRYSNLEIAAACGVTETDDSQLAPENENPAEP
ncbi:MAG: hypothetical protein R3C05_09305 [Pirellulaceae bacterium]